MGVDLNLWALNKEERTYVKYELERTSAIWNDIKSLASLSLPNDFDEYEAYTLYSQFNNKGLGRRQKQEPILQKRKIVKKEGTADAYGKNLLATEAFYLKTLATDDSIRFENRLIKDEFLKLPDDTQVILYWY